MCKTIGPHTNVAAGGVIANDVVRRGADLRDPIEKLDSRDGLQLPPSESSEDRIVETPAPIMSGSVHVNGNSAMMREEPLTKTANVAMDDWCCCMCNEILYEPLTLPCGHTFCRVCLYRWFIARTYEKVCPTCRAQCVRIVPQIGFVNVIISNFVQTTFPVAYTHRAHECNAIKATWPEPLFINFSANVVLPFQTVTVTFTEMRYLAMVDKLTTKTSGEKSFLLLPPAPMKRGDIGIVIVIEETVWKTDACGRRIAECQLRAERRCKVMDCWLTDQIEGLHSAQVESFEDIQPEPPTIISTDSSIADERAVAFPSTMQSATTPTVELTPRAKAMTKLIRKDIVPHIERADQLTKNQFSQQQNMCPPPLDNPTKLSWWLLAALKFDGAGLQARVPVVLTSSFLHSRDPFWRLQIGLQLLQQLLVKLRERAVIKNAEVVSLPDMPYAESYAAENCGKS